MHEIIHLNIMCKHTRTHTHTHTHTYIHTVQFRRVVGVYYGLLFSSGQIPLYILYKCFGVYVTSSYQSQSELQFNFNCQASA